MSVALYGYTLTVWTSGVVLTHARGIPSAVNALLLIRDDPREVLPDPHTTCYGAELNERTLLPGHDASLDETRFEDWLSRSTAQQQRTLSVKGV